MIYEPQSMVEGFQWVVQGLSMFYFFIFLLKCLWGHRRERNYKNAKSNY